MIEKNNLEQQGGENSKNYQSNGPMTIINGLSYNEAKELFIDLFNSNFPKLKEEAAKTVSERVKEITEEVIDEYFNKEKYRTIDFSNPSTQNNLYSIQKDYAVIGDKQLKKILVEIFLNLGISKERNVNQLILNECLHIAPKLTINQISYLTIQYIFYNYSFENKEYDLNQFKEFFSEIFIPLLENSVCDFMSIKYLQHFGCIEPRDNGNSKEAILQFLNSRFHPYLSKSIDEDDLKIDLGNSFKHLNLLYKKSVFDNSKYQIIQKSAYDFDFLVQNHERKEINLAYNKHYKTDSNEIYTLLNNFYSGEYLIDIVRERRFMQFSSTFIGTEIGKVYLNLIKENNKLLENKNSDHF